MSATPEPTTEHLTAARMFLAAHGKRTGWTLQHPLARWLAAAEHAAYLRGWRECRERAAVECETGCPKGTNLKRELWLGRAAAAIRALEPE